MKIRIALLLLVTLGGVLGTVASAAPEASTGPKMKPITFNGGEYLHRWSKADQHEFTPRGQEDLTRWADMVTINHYRAATDGEGLAGIANAVLENYKANKAVVVRTDSVPRTAEKPAEYLIVVLFPRPEFIEAVFARFKLVDGVGAAAIYSHREYGAKIGDQMSAWLQKNGPGLEKTLMAFEPIPGAVALEP